MKTKRSSAKWFTWVLAVSVILIAAGSGALSPGPRDVKAPAAPQGQASSAVLEYRMPDGQVLKYEDKSELRQVSDLMGESVESLIMSTGAYSFQAKGPKERNFLLGVTIENMGMTITARGRDMSPDLKPVKGKSFDMVLSPLGTEVDVSGAEAITYEVAGNTRNIATTFKVFFPDLPDKAVKIGDSWPSSYVIEEKSGPTSMRMEFQSLNTLEGWETVDGMECARITAKVTSTISGTGKQQGMDMSIDGTSKGKDVWYFAVKEGIFVKATSELTTEMTTSLTGAQTMTIPTTQTRTNEVKLVGR